MSEPLDLEPIKSGMTSAPHAFDAVHRALLAEVERLRGEAESEARARRFNSKMSNYLMDVIGRDEPEVREAEARIKAGDNHSEENSFGHIAAAYIMRLRGEVARQAEQITAVQALFAGGPDTPCVTTWRYHHDGWTTPSERTECVEVPLDDLRAVLGDA